MSAEAVTLEIDTGVPLRELLQLCDADGTSINLAGCSFEAGIRPRAGVDPLVVLTVTIEDEAAGEISINATAEVTAELADETARAWNLIMTDALGHEAVILRGPVKLTGVIQ